MSNDVEKSVYEERESGLCRRWLSFQELIAQTGCAMFWLLQGVYNHCRIWRTAIAEGVRRPKFSAAERGTEIGALSRSRCAEERIFRRRSDRGGILQC